MGRNSWSLVFFEGRGGWGQGYPDLFYWKIPNNYAILEVGHFKHACENDLVCVTTCGKIPYFNAPVFFENKEQIGKIDEIFGGITDNVTKNFLNKKQKKSNIS